MSSIQVVNQAETKFLTSLAPVNKTLRLYKNNVTSGLTPDQIEALTESSFTEADFPGYAAISITSGWVISAGNPSVAINTLRTFTRSSTGTAQNIFGYYFTRNADSQLEWFEHFDGPIVVTNNGDAIQITPRLTLDDFKGNEVRTGTIIPYGSSTVPTGYLACNGAAVSRTTFAALFSVIGTSYGTGDGSTTFNVPDLRQRFPMGKATAGTGATLGGTGGSVDHTHDLNTSSSFAAAVISSNIIDTARRTGVSWPITHRGAPTMAVTSPGGSQTIGLQLGGLTDSDNPPFQTVEYMIKT